MVSKLENGGKTIGAHGKIRKCGFPGKINTVTYTFYCLYGFQIEQGTYNQFFEKICMFLPPEIDHIPFIISKTGVKNL